MSMMIIAVKILGADEGFLPKALMLANPEDAMIAQGPKIQKKKMSIMAVSRFTQPFPSDNYLSFNNDSD